MGGILKNKADAGNAAVTQSTKEFREQVLKNTKLNAMLKDFKPEFFNENGEVDMQKLESLSEADQEKLQWNHQNLSDNAEIQKKIIENMETSIDEPKTPFQHAAEINEYYQPDDEEELNGFSLGEPEIKVDELDEKFERPVHPEELEADQENGEFDDDEEEDEEQKEQPKKKMTFDELRKMHYHNEVPKFHPVDDEDDEDA